MASVEQVIEQIRQRKATLCFAESCTGGGLASRIVSIPGVSDVFVGSFVTYTNKMKEEILGVSPFLLTSLGAVSQPVAFQMARGARALTQSTWAVSVTGIAGPKGGTDKKPVGTVCFSVVGPGVQWTATEFFSGPRDQIQNLSVEFAIDSLWKQMK